MTGNASVPGAVSRPVLWLAAFHRAAIRLSSWLLVLCAACLVVMTAVIVALVASRYLFGHSFAWAEEVTRFLLVWMVMLAMAVIQRADNHIRVAFLVEYLPEKIQALIALVFRIVIMGFLVLLVRYGWTAAVGMDITRSPGLDLSMTWPYLAIPVGALVTLGFSLLGLADDIRRLLSLEPLRPDAGRSDFDEI